MRNLRKYLERLHVGERDFKDRLFVILTMVTAIALLAEIVFDILLGENIIEITAIAAFIILSLLVCDFSVYNKRSEAGKKILVLVFVFVLQPIRFFYGGGINGGAIIWFSFAFMYTGMLLTGRWRTVTMCFLTAIAVCEYYITYYHSELIYPHTVSVKGVDMFVSMLIVGLIIYIMIRFQDALFVRENEKAREEAEKVEEMSKAQNRFFSNMSHEIRTPINTIIGLNEMILREEISDEVAEDAANIQAAGKILLHLINDILDMSKIQSGQMELTKAVYNPGDMLSEIVAMLWIRAKDKGLEFHVNVAPDIPAELYGDEVRIKQILINVINNAIKYTKEGSVTLSVQCGDRNGDHLNIVYSVTDTGIGIKKESIPHLFNAFKRVDDDNTRYIEGTGLGLSIVKQLVDLMEGKLTVNSVYTKGTTFVVEIPQKVMNNGVIGDIDVERRHVINSRVQYKQKFEAPNARLLVVDDNESNLLVVTKLLRDTHIQIDTALSGKEALKLTLNNEYHVIFMDHLMPEMDGIECHARIVNQTGGMSRDAKIVALTANAGEDNKQLYRKEGFDGYIEKPVSGNVLERELYRLLPSDLVSRSSEEEEITEETMQWMQSHERKKAVAVTTESVADLPTELLEKYGIKLIPHMVATDEGTFRDGLEIDTDGLLAYMEDEKRKVKTCVYDAPEHEIFFADNLTGANNVVHVALSSRVTNSGYPSALEAARAFGNVMVIDSHHLSSGQGLIALEACRLAEEGKTPSEIEAALETFIPRVHTSFVVNELDFLARAGQVSHTIANLTRAFMMRPVLVMKKGRLQIGRIYLGSKERAWRKYIDSVLTPYNNIDTKILFVTYVGISNREKEKIRSYIDKRMKFDEIYFQKASPAIAVNCGAGTFGLLYRELT
ncbi:MAG: DegV family EDD domain-containing protein [Lachnospiraceae bacterium]|nr:DegV family EDD domain-containing protein [Lachnospiraceae bacterium]